MYRTNVVNEKCEKFPSLYQRDCAHCRGTARGTAQNPNFSTIEYFYRGYPVVEILKNGGQVHRHDKHFRFGCRVARILLACLPALKTFAWPYSERDRTEFEPQIFVESTLGITIEVFVEMNPNFVVGDELIDKYWLSLRELPTAEIAQREESCMAPQQVQEFFNQNGYDPTIFVPRVPREAHKGLGVMKCRAVCSVQDELRNWLARRCR
jgi:hypothetical protein